ncbi:MAG: T9SS type A sorting domain-containing protein [Bacteroidota bacterium]
MKKLLIIFFISFFCATFAQQVSISNGWYYIDGKKFFVKGIGYETHTRPGQAPWLYSFDADLIRVDLQRIKDAGFNTIRTWGALKEEELALVEESGLKILFGIWIDPHGDFGSTSFVNSAANHVNEVLNYSKNYNCIIGYLIMNEPQVAHIYDAGSQNLLNLWNTIIDLIHQKDPGIPVSFSNTMIGDYINMDIFDFAGYNAYIYNPVTISNSHGYSGFLKFLKENRAQQKPFIVTEYGLSVSPGTPGDKYQYGSNTVQQQMEGDLLMYRNLIDAGTQGGVVFQYHDGWWKGGNEFVHDDSPEEWFGLIEFTNYNDKYGTERPVWSAYKTYNKAIITEPKNEEIISGLLPIEIFTTDDVASFSVYMNDSLLLNQSISGNYFSGELNLDIEEETKDLQLYFYFCDSSGDTLKSEMVSVLYAKETVQLPKVTLQILPANLQPGGQNYLLMDITNNPLFTINDNRIDYAVHSHIGFDAGTAKYRVIQLINNRLSFYDNFDIPSDTKVATFGAGFTIKYGTFSKRISAQNIFTHTGWAVPIQASDVITEVEEQANGSESIPTKFELMQNYPNPFNPSTTIEYTIPNVETTRRVVFTTLKVYDILGREVATLVNEYQLPGKYSIKFGVGTNRRFALQSGVYFYTLRCGQFTSTKKLILLK